VGRSCQWICLAARFGCGATYKVGVGGLEELLLGAVTDVGICTRVSQGVGNVENAVKATHPESKFPPTPS
jgi:hypothetical protein